uniref:DDE_3 domain-containing protein n=1 Tax=Heterorhabditis bacteriophora TaxID=37862 RepID=A0A1I7X8G7_HETBA
MDFTTVNIGIEEHNPAFQEINMFGKTFTVWIPIFVSFSSVQYSGLAGYFATVYIVELLAYLLSTLNLYGMLIMKRSALFHCNTVTCIYYYKINYILSGLMRISIMLSQIDIIRRDDYHNNGSCFYTESARTSQIKALSTAGYTVKRIADVVKRSRKAIMNFLRHQEEYDTKKSSGRPSKLNDREKREILRTASNSTISINEIRRTCDIDASESTVWRMLNTCPNVVRLRMKKYPELTQAHKNERLCWIRIFVKCDWEKDVFRHHLVPHLQRCPGVSFTFQQDNARIHASRSTKTWLDDNDMATMEWPSRSSDLNPMKNLWAIFVCQNLCQ